MINKIVDQVRQFKIIILAVIAISTVTVGVMNHPFALAEELSDHIRQRELKDTRDIAMKLQLSYGCYRQTCQGEMPDQLYIEYVKYLNRIEELIR